MNHLGIFFLICELSTFQVRANLTSQASIIAIPTSGLESAPLLRLDQDSQEIDPIIPKNSAIVGKTLSNTTLDPKRKHDLPLTLLTALPVYSSGGGIALPSNTILTAIIQKRDGGDYITVEKAVYRGLNISIPSHGRLIPAQVKPEDYGNFIMPPKSKASTVAESVVNSNLISTLLGVALANSTNDDGKSNVPPLLIGVLAADVGIRLVSALFDRDAKERPPLVEIPEDSLIVFTVSEDVKLPSSSGPETPLPQ